MSEYPLLRGDYKPREGSKRGGESRRIKLRKWCQLS